jgi:flagellar basal-body rod protein FlgC
MALFGALDAAASGASLSSTWLEAISDNVANVNTVRPAGEEPFRAKLVVAQSVPGALGKAGRGVAVAGMVEAQGAPQQVYDPEDPNADANGMVKRPVVDLGEEMTNMLVASRTYQANLAVMDRVRDAYLKALEIGRH